MTLETYTESIPSDINEIILKSKLDEGFDYKNSKFLVVGKENDKYVGLVAYGESQVGRITYPRFLHIIITPEFKRSKTAYKMLQESENELRKLGHNVILCHILFVLPNREIKRRYALKFGYEKYFEDSLGESFFKPIKET